MNTAVQLRRVAGDAPRSDLFHGTPGSIISGGEPLLGLMQVPIAWAKMRDGLQGASASPVQTPGTWEHRGALCGSRGEEP